MLSLVSHTLATAKSHIARGNFLKARKLVRRHLRQHGSQAEAWHLLGVAWENDPNGSDELAFKCFRRAVLLQPQFALARACLGRAAARIERDALAVKMLASAAKIAPADVNVLTAVIEAYLEMNRTNEAWTLACRARFVLPGNAAMTTLWNRVRFAMTAKQIDQATVESAAHRVLPFLRVVGGDERHDRFSVGTPHFQLKAR
jgi:cytochrome c-type biogenesis protein CcmH/NrfG